MLKKLSLTILLAVFTLISFTTVSANEGLGFTEQITLFKSDINLEQNTDININEEIYYYFPDARHGLIREIPTDYKVAGGLKRPTILSIRDIYYFKKSEPNKYYREYERSNKNGYTIFKIGDPENTITGEYVFVIKYTLKNAINYFDSHDELYLNITGNGWEVPINQSFASITTPGEITESVCFSGLLGETSKNCTIEKVSGNEVKVSVTKSLLKYEGYTLALKMPKGTLEDTQSRQVLASIVANAGFLLPIPLSILIYIFLIKPSKNKKITIIPNYDVPKGVFPLLAGYIYKTSLINKHITAEIIKLAIDGYIKIVNEGKNKYKLVKLERDDEIAEKSVKDLLEGIFGNKNEILTKNIPSDFYLTVNSIRGEIDKKVYSMEYFDIKKRNRKTLLIVLSVILMFVSFFLASFLAEIAAASWGLGLLITGFIALMMSLAGLEIRGEKGNILYYELLGLRMYINTAEKHRIEFHNDPKKFMGVFEKLLPYAIIFGLEKRWAKEFQDIYKEPPSWYDGDIRTFNTYVLANSISQISSNVQSKSVNPTNSSGGFSSSHWGSGGSGFSGGSSGGGGGGGGGGSW